MLNGLQYTGTLNIALTKTNRVHDADKISSDHCVEDQTAFSNESPLIILEKTCVIPLDACKLFYEFF